MYQTMQKRLISAAILTLVTGIGAGSAQAQERTLPVKLVGQQTNSWCWATTLQMSVALSATIAPQCAQANARFGRNDCCNSPTPASCIQGGWPDYARVNHNSMTTAWGTALTFAQIRAEIDAGRPVNFSWGWTGGGGHIMVAGGYKVDSLGNQWVWKNDPWPVGTGASSYISYAEYVSAAGDHEHWQDYYAISRRGLNCAPAVGSKVAFKADTGNWLTRCNSCQVSVNNSCPDTVTMHVTVPTGTAVFTVVDAGGGKLGLQADSGKYVARCNGCIVGAPPDMLTIHATTPFPITFEQTANGKCALKLDTGKYAGRCNGCSPGAAYPDTVAVKDSDFSQSWTQFEMNTIF